MVKEVAVNFKLLFPPLVPLFLKSVLLPDLSVGKVALVAPDLYVPGDTPRVVRAITVIVMPGQVFE